MNKCDLADEKLNQKWVECLSKEAPVILTDANTGKGIEKVTKKIDELMKEELERQYSYNRQNDNTIYELNQLLERYKNIVDRFGVRYE